MMLGYKLGPYMSVCWAFATPLFTTARVFCYALKYSRKLFKLYNNFVLQVLLVLVCISADQLKYDQSYTYPQWSVVIGWLMMTSCVAAIPITAIYKIATTPGSLVEVRYIIF